ncbi:WD40/YVTN/BNR-like repeat-containing protein [Streptomyces sp. A144]|uniref:WD40/YVTN/BNR-like repeat-containing protein n=1 Tax=Streptomyces sp. A144 TaxID=2871487 RepID=UPI0035E41D8F
MRRSGNRRRTVRTANGTARTGGGGRPGRTAVAGAVCAAALAALTAAPAQAHQRPHWDLKDTGAAGASDVRFRGLAAVSRDTAWVAGTRGTVLTTTDGGATWRNVSPPGAGELQFRDVEAFDARRAVVLAIGEGEASRIYRTDDGGATWTESFRNTDPRAFYDCLTFFDRRHGLAMSDPVEGKFRILSTSDGGRSWKVLPDRGMPAAQDGEAGFAASGQCLVASGPGDVWLATGGAARARVLHSADRGLTWTATDAPVPAGDPARGVFALAFRDRAHGLAVGGDFRPGQASPRAAARTADAGRTWRSAGRSPDAYRSGVAWLPHSRTAALAVGPTGTDLTTDAGRTWRTVDTGSYDTVDCTADRGCWAAGEQGRVARLER